MIRCLQKLRISSFPRSSDRPNRRSSSTPETDDAWKDVLRIVSIGEQPWQVGNIDAMVTIANPRLKKVVALDANGMISPIDVRAAFAGGKLTVTVPNGTLYLVASGDESTR